MPWTSPTGFVEDAWIAEALAYDEIVDYSHAAFSDQISPGYNTDYLELTHAAINCDKVRVCVGLNETDDLQGYDVEVYYGGAWHATTGDNDVFNAWNEFAIGSTQSVTAMRFIGYNDSEELGVYFYLEEADFGEVEAGQTILDYERGAPGANRGAMRGTV